MGAVESVGGVAWLLPHGGMIRMEYSVLKHGEKEKSNGSGIVTYV
jgi:hypothetical protein